jgi:hypothetical protein
MQMIPKIKPFSECWEVYFDSFGKAHVAPLSVRYNPSLDADAYRLQKGLLFTEKADAAARAANLNLVLMPYLYATSEE